MTSPISEQTRPELKKVIHQFTNPCNHLNASLLTFIFETDEKIKNIVTTSNKLILSNFRQ